ncbi:unnamed protein product [Cochlearia groenlandica]
MAILGDPIDIEVARKFGPCMKRLLKKHRGYIGPITINAFGVLTDYHVEILRALSSNGITLTYSPFAPTDITMSVLAIFWAKPPPSPPPNIIVLTDPEFFPDEIKKQHNILYVFSDYYPLPEEAITTWTNFIQTVPLEEKEEEEEEEEYMSMSSTETDESANNNNNNNWCCSICNKLSGQGFDSFIPHFSSPEHVCTRLWMLPMYAYKHRDKFYKEDEVPFTTVWTRPVEFSSVVTSVFWDLSRFPVPSGFDPLLVVQRIQRLMDHLGYSISPTPSMLLTHPRKKSTVSFNLSLPTESYLFPPAAAALTQPCEGYTLFQPFSRDEVYLWGNFIRADIVSTEKYIELQEEEEEEYKFEEDYEFEEGGEEEEGGGEEDYEFEGGEEEG